jgi:hypothetical protein
VRQAVRGFESDAPERAGDRIGGDGGGNGALVDALDPLGHMRPGEALRRLAGGLPHGDPAGGVVVEALELLGQALGVSGRDQDAVDAVLDHIGVAGDVGGYDRRARCEGLGEDHAEALTRERGRAEDIRRRKLGPEAPAIDDPECLDGAHGIGIGEEPRDLLGVGADDDEPCRDMLGERFEGAQENRQALSLLAPADEEKPELPIGAGQVRCIRRGAEVHPVGNHLVVAAEPAPSRPLRGLRDRDPGTELVELPPRPEQVGDVVRHELGGVGMEGADDRSIGEGARVPADRRGGRLVDMDDVEATVAQLAAEPHHRVGEDREVRDRTVGREAHGAPERGQVIGQRAISRLGAAMERTAEAVRRIPGREYTNLVAPPDQMLGEGLGMPVDAPLIRP